LVLVVRHSQYGPPADTVEVVDEDPGPLSEGEALVELLAAPIAFQDFYRISGRPGFARPLPDVPGNRGVGRVIAVAPDVGRVAVGDRVYLPFYNRGCWREHMRCAAAALHGAPKHADPYQLAMVNGNLLTAYVMLRDVVPDLSPGEWVIQDAANSNCGNFVIQLARAFGLRTVNVVRRPGLEAELAAEGADAVVVDGPNLAERVQVATGRAPIRLALDMVAGSTTGRLAASLAPFGTVAVYGQVSGQECDVPVHVLLFRQVRVVGFLTGPWLERSKRSPAAIDAIYDELSELVVKGVVRSRIAGVYPFAHVGDALRHAAESGGRRGKVLLTPR